MISFARVRTKFLLEKFRFSENLHLKNQNSNKYSDEAILENQSSQNKHFFQAIKGGGMWFC